MSAYVGRFAPSPTGLLHAGSLVAALASWLDAKAHDGRWLVRIEDIDPPRCQAGADQAILQQLAQCGLLPDAPPLWQSQRHSHYQQALEALKSQNLAYPCGCTRRSIEAAQAALGQVGARHQERPYPGTCRHGLQGGAERAWRLHTERYQAQQAAATPPLQTSTAASATLAQPLISAAGVRWQDRRLGVQTQNVAKEVGDFVLRRADGLWAYQLAVVVDDAAQGITHIVRGEDLADNTARQILLQQALGLSHPRYLHTPLVRMANGEKLSKQHGAPAIDASQPLLALNAAAQQLGLPSSPAASTAQALHSWVSAWAQNYNRAW